MKIAVTGGTGFIGQHLIDSLIGQGHEVFLISRHEMPSTRAGVTPLTGMAWSRMCRCWRASMRS